MLPDINDTELDNIMVITTLLYDRY